MREEENDARSRVVGGGRCFVDPRNTPNLATGTPKAHKICYIYIYALFFPTCLLPRVQVHWWFVGGEEGNNAESPHFECATDRKDLLIVKDPSTETSGKFTEDGKEKGPRACLLINRSTIL